MKRWTRTAGRAARAGAWRSRRGADRHQARHRLRHGRQVRQILQRRREPTAPRSSRRRPGIAVAEFEPSNETQFEQAHRRFAQRGQDPIVAVGFSQAVALEKVAKEFPNIHFTIIDMRGATLPNVQSVVFKEQEGSFLVGVLAALASKTGKVGFVGGMDIPLIRRFQCGYEQGVKYANPKAELIAEHDRHDARRLERSGPRRASSPRASSTAASTWSTPRPARTGIGVLQAAKDRGKLGDRRRFQPEPPASRHDADLDDQARRCRRLQQLQGGAGRHLEGAACRCSA